MAAWAGGVWKMETASVGVLCAAIGRRFKKKPQRAEKRHRMATSMERLIFAWQILRCAAFCVGVYRIFFSIKRGVVAVETPWRRERAGAA
jgi:hypothetical protein